MTQGRILQHKLVRILFRSKVGLIDIPAKLFFVAFAFQFKVEVDWDEDFFGIGGSFLFNVENVGSEDELFVDGFVEGGVAGPSGVKVF